MPLPAEKTIEELNKGFYVLGMNVDALTEEQKALLPSRYILWQPDKHTEEVATFFHLRLPLTSPEDMLSYAEHELQKSEQAFEKELGNKLVVKIIDRCIKLFFGKRAMHLIEKAYREVEPIQFFKDLYAHMFEGTKYFYAYPQEVYDLGRWDSILFGSIQRAFLYGRYRFYRRCVEHLQEKITPTYRDHRPPRNLNEWLYQIDAVREAHKKNPLDL